MKPRSRRHTTLVGFLPVIRPVAQARAPELLLTVPGQTPGVVRDGRRANVPDQMSRGHGSTPASAPAGIPVADDRVTADPVRAECSALPDLLAPACLEVGRDFLILDGRYARTFALIQYPRTVVLGWLNRLVCSGEHLDLSLHLVPLDTALAQSDLTARMTQLRSSQLSADKRGHIDDAETGTALGDCRRVRQALQQGHETLLSVSLYVTVYGSSAADLEARARRVQRLFTTLMAQTRPAVWQAQAGLYSTLPAGRDGLRVRRNLPSSSVVTLFPFTAPRLEMEGGVLWGRNSDTNGLVLVTPWTQPNANVAVMATSGAGKSYAIKLDLLRTLPLGIYALVIDPDGEYTGLATALQGQVVRLGPGSAHRLNPLALPCPPRESAGVFAENTTLDQDDDGDKGGTSGSPAHDALAAHMASLLPLLEVLLAGEDSRLTPREKGVLEQGMATCYGAAGITADTTTHDRPPPIFADLTTTLAACGDTTGLADRLERYCTGPYAGIFNGQSTVDLDNRLVVFSLAGLPEETTEPEVRTGVMLLIAAHVLRTAQRDRRQRRRVIIDEAHVLARHPAGDLFLANMARRARKYGLGVTAISQQLDDFLATMSGQAVLKNSSTRLLLLQTSETLAALQQHLQLTQIERTRLLTCDRGEGLLLIGRQRVFVRLEASSDEHRLCHSDAAAHVTMSSAVETVSLFPTITSLSSGAPAQHDSQAVSSTSVPETWQERESDPLDEAEENATPMNGDTNARSRGQEAVSPDPERVSASWPAAPSLPPPSPTASVTEVSSSRSASAPQISRPFHRRRR